MPTFLDWWKKYPKKVARKDASRAWERLETEEKLAAYRTIDRHVRYWLINGVTLEFVPYAAKWLNGERWEDEVILPGDYEEAREAIKQASHA